jgi:hypothetical protein
MQRAADSSPVLSLGSAPTVEKVHPGWSVGAALDRVVPAVRSVGSGVIVNAVCCFSESDGGRRWALPGGEPAIRVRPRERE